MISLERYVGNFTNEELQECFLEIYQWRVEGTLPIDSVTRIAWNGFKKQSGQDSFPIHAMPEAIFFEICKRKYREDGINV